MQQTCTIVGRDQMAHDFTLHNAPAVPLRFYRGQFARVAGLSLAQLVKPTLGSIKVSPVGTIEENAQADTGKSHTLAALGLQRDPKAIAAYIAERSRELNALG